MRIPEVPYAGPFDGAGPQYRRHVTQAGYGGPFVIRSNPFGAILDTIRGFCFPVPMTEDEGVYYDDSGQGFGSPGAPDFPLLGDAGPGYASPFAASGSGILGAQCGPGTRYDPDTRQCMPISSSMGDTSTVISPCGSEALEEASRRLLMAVQACDLTGITQVQLTAGVCSRIAPKTLRLQWKALANQAAKEAKSHKTRCKMASIRATMAPPGMMTPGMQEPNSPATFTEGNARMTANPMPMRGMVDPQAQPEARQVMKFRRGWSRT